MNDRKPLSSAVGLGARLPGGSPGGGQSVGRPLVSVVLMLDVGVGVGEAG